MAYTQLDEIVEDERDKDIDEESLEIIKSNYKIEQPILTVP